MSASPYAYYAVTLYSHVPAPQGSRSTPSGAGCIVIRAPTKQPRSQNSLVKFIAARQTSNLQSPDHPNQRRITTEVRSLPPSTNDAPAKHSLDRTKY
jgi:hypothetical protein